LAHLLNSARPALIASPTLAAAADTLDLAINRLVLVGNLGIASPVRSVAAVPSGPAEPELADPVVTPAPVFADEPDDCAVPALLVPGAGGAATFVELPAPLGSLPELFRPPAFAGPDGTPLTPAVPEPVEPAFGEPTALPEPAVGPLAAPPPPALAAPALCANETMGDARMAIAVTAAVTDALFIADLLFPN
jgi:hypothetical protein